MKTDVRDAEGRKLGAVRDLVFDAKGEILFVILSYGGFLGIGAKKAAVPFEALRWNAEKKGFMLDRGKERLEWAYDYRKDTLRDPQTAADICRVYGVQPRWEFPETGKNPGYRTAPEPVTASRPGNGRSTREEPDEQYDPGL